MKDKWNIQRQQLSNDVKFTPQTCTRETVWLWLHECVSDVFVYQIKNLISWTRARACCVCMCECMHAFVGPCQVERIPAQRAVCWAIPAGPSLTNPDKRLTATREDNYEHSVPCDFPPASGHVWAKVHVWQENPDRCPFNGGLMPDAPFVSFPSPHHLFFRSSMAER